MAISIDIHRITKAEAHTVETGSPFSYVETEDKSGLRCKIYISNGPFHWEKAKHLADAFRFAFNIEQEAKQ
jgi:hypothetical protein